MQPEQPHKIGSLDPVFLVGTVLILTVLQLSSLFSGDIIVALKDSDFVNYWLSGRLVFEHKTSALFGNLDGYMAELIAHNGPQLQPRYWSYPPHFLFFTMPLGLLSYFPAMAIFMILTVTLFLFGARLFIGKLSFAACVMLSPFIVFNLIAGQNGFLTGGLMLLGLGWRKSRPILAGIAFGMLTIKPQLGILLPFLLLAERRYSVIVAALVTTSIMVTASIAAFGFESWQGYISNNLPEMKNVMWQWDGIFLSFMPSLFASLRALGMASNLALGLHLVFASIIFLGSVRAFLRCKDDHLRTVLVIAATFAISPYSFVYDAGPLVCAAIMLLPYLGEKRVSLVPIGVTLLPLAAFPLGLICLPVAPLIIAAMIFVAVRTIIAGLPAALSN